MLDQLTRRLRGLPPLAVDGVLAIILMVSADLVPQERALQPAHLVTVALSTLPVTLRRRFPIGVAWAIGVSLLLNLAVGHTNSFFETFALLLVVYTMVTAAPPGPWLWLTLAIELVGLHVSFLIDWHNKDQVNISDLPYNYLIFSLTIVLGYSVRTRRAYIAQLEEQARLLAAKAATDERARIARELHDVVAHSVSVMVLQATAGNRVAQRDPGQAAGTFEVIQETGRTALADLRRVIGVLRTEADTEANLEPQPGLDQVEALVAGVRAAGMAVDLHVRGRQRRLPSAVELSAFRIIQESLTNVLKHAGAGRADVMIDYGESDLRLEIRDDGKGANGSGGGGHGVAGMRERVRMFGGELRAEAVHNGFLVVARLPLEPAR